MRILVLRPDFDLATRFGAYFLGLTLPRIRLFGEVRDLYQPDPKEATEVVEEFKPDVVIGEGHGWTGGYTLQFKRTWLITDVNDQLMASKMVYLLSCQTGASLGKAIYEHGAKIYAGYTRDFIFITKTEDPKKSKYAIPFFEAGIGIALALLNYQDPAKVQDYGMKMWNSEIKKWERIDDPAAPFIIASLIHDRDCFVVYPSVKKPISIPIAPILAVGMLGLALLRK